MPCAEMIEDDIEDSWFERVATVFAFVLIFIVVVVMGAISAVVWLLNRALARFDYEIIEPDLKGRHGYRLVRPIRDHEKNLQEQAERSESVARFQSLLKKV